MAVLKTYIGAVKPVGEKIVLNYSHGATAGAVVSDDFDFILDQNYYVTGVFITKMVSNLVAANNLLSALVMRVPVSGTPVIAVDVIGQAAVSGATAGVYGQTAIAGMPTMTAAAAASLVVAPITAPDVTGQTVASYMLPTVAVQANSTVAGTATSRQRIRLKITANPNGGDFNPSCLVVVELAKYTSGIAQGDTSNSNQLGEVLIPTMV
jgi:hypothetical protein